MASTDSSLPSESTAETGVIFRRGLLHPFGVSLSIIVEKACTKAQDHLDLDLDHDHGPIAIGGSVTKKIAAFLKLALPFMYAVQYQWLILLTFVDDHIIVVVNMLTTIFPPSKRLFNKIDRLIDAVETLPAKFDNAMNKFPVFPFLHWVLTTCIAWMNFLIPTFTQYWRSSNDTWEKEIMVDINCESCNNNDQSQNDDHCCENLERSALLESNACKVVNCSAQCDDDSKTWVPKSDQEAKTVGTTNMKCSYKEILEKGKNESAEKKEDCVTDQENGETYFSTDEAEEKDGNGSNENIVSEDPILELFEASWHMNPTKGTSFPTSYSFT